MEKEIIAKIRTAFAILQGRVSAIEKTLALKTKQVIDLQERVGGLETLVTQLSTPEPLEYHQETEKLPLLKETRAMLCATPTDGLEMEIEEKRMREELDA